LTVKPVKYKGVSFSDYIGFRNLQPSTTYKAVLEVLVGGKTIRKSVKIKTREERVDVTPSPPKCTKDFYDTKILITDNNYDDVSIINLNSVCKSPKDNIKYQIINTTVSNSSKYTGDVVKIRNNILKVDQLSSFIHGTRGRVFVRIRATTKGGFHDISVQFDYSLKPFEDPTDAPAPVCHKKTYNTGITIINDDFETSNAKLILDLTDKCIVVAGDSVSYSIVEVIDPYYLKDVVIDSDILQLKNSKVYVKLNDALRQEGKGDKAEMIVKIRASSMSKKYVDILVTFSYLLAIYDPTKNRRLP